MEDTARWMSRILPVSPTYFQAPGSQVLSGAVNGDRVRSQFEPKSSPQIHGTRRSCKSCGPRNSNDRTGRLGDQLGAFYPPLALAIAIAAWILSSDARRFLAVLVVATPCPLLIGIPVAIIGEISLAARRGIIVRNPAALENR